MRIIKTKLYVKVDGEPVQVGTCIVDVDDGMVLAHKMGTHSAFRIGEVPSADLAKIHAAIKRTSPEKAKEVKT